MMLAERVAAPAAAEARGFGYGEHLLVWSWRRIVAGRAECPLLAREFADACGEDGAEVFATFCTFLRALGFASRRRLAIGEPGSLAVTADERQMLTLVAAAQAAAPALLEAHLRWLTEPDRRHVLQIAAGALANALAANDLRVALPKLDRPQVCERPLAVS
jgi:hypothetical protein